MISSSQSAESSLVLDEIAAKIARLPQADQECILPDLLRLRACLEASERDILKYQARLQASNERFHLLADHSPLCIWMTDVHGGNEYINQTYCDFLGVTLDQVSGLNWQVYLHPEDAPTYLAAFQKAVKLQTDFRSEVRVRRADGAWRWVESHTRPYYTHTGALAGFVGNSLDITDRKESEAFTRATLVRATWLARLPAENPNPMVRITSTGEVIYYNRAVEGLPEWGFVRGGPLPAQLAQLLADAFTTGKKVQQDLQLGEREYAITILPFQAEAYSNIYGLDVTERKQFARALLLANAQLRFYVDSNLVGIIIGSEAGRVVEVNDFYLRLIGYTRQDFENGLVDWRVITPPEYIWLDERAIVELKEHGMCAPYEKEYIRKDGTRIWVHLRDALMPDGKILALVLDISERKQAENFLEQVHAELTRERNRLLTVMQALPIGLAILDPSGGVIQANQNYENVWGGSRPRTKSIADYRHYHAWWGETGKPVELEEWASSQAVKHGKTVTGQFMEIQKFDGSRAYILNSSAPIFDSDGQLSGAVVVIMDITERVGTERALQDSKHSLRISEDRFRVALAAVPLFVYTCDQDLRYTWVYNQPQGMRDTDLIGKRDDEILTPEAAAEMIAAKQSALDSGQGSVKEIKVPLSGKDTYAILTIEPMKNSAGQVTGLTCSAIDITEQKLLEIEQEEYEMRMEVQHRLMEFRERERQELARDLHDGPIQLVSGTIFHLQSTKEMIQEPLLKVEVEQAAHILKGAVRELRDIMNELRPPAVIQFGFAKTVRLYAEDFRERYSDLTLTLDLFEDGDLLPEVTRLALFRIFQESLNNIAHHAGASHVWIRFTRSEKEIRLEIRDDGVGFSVPTDMVAQTLSGHYGLAGMKERIEAIGGQFEVSSIPGAGTTVHVVLPPAEQSG